MSPSADAASELLTSPINVWHVQAGAKFAEFGGWSMPLEYAGVVSEHTAVREAVGLFDVSHLGKARISGPGAAAYVNSVLSNDLGKISAGQAQYTLLCTPDGGVVDDLIAYLRSDDEVFLIPNAANTAEVVRVLAEAAPPEIEVVDQHREFAVIAVQGPQADDVLQALGLPNGHDYMSWVAASFEGVELTVCRTGYTGERGYELVAPNEIALALWSAIIAAGAPFGITPAGLGARDTLRTEMGYPLHGQDISPEISPLDARLGWAIGWKKPGFRGDVALREAKALGPRRVLRGLTAVGRGIPRPGMAVQRTDGEPLGVVTSGTFSPTKRIGIALALIDSSVDEGEVLVDVRGRSAAFVITKPPFVDSSVR